MKKQLLCGLAIAILVLSVAAIATAAPYNVFVHNSQFDRLNNGFPITSKQNNLSTVLEWDGGGGVEWTIRAFVSPQQSIYTYLPETIALGDTWTLDATCYAGWPSWADDLEARLFWHDGGGARTTIASYARTNAGPMNVSFTATAGDSFLGKNIGIEFYSPIHSGGWTQVDNVSLTVDPGPTQYVPITVANHSFESGQASWGFSGGGVTDHDGETDATYAAWFGSGAEAWQGLGETIDIGETYRLLLDTHQTGGSGSPLFTTSLFYYSPGDDLSNPANRHPLATLVQGLTSTFQTVQLKYLADASASGKLLGVEFGNTGSGWLGVDNIRVSSAPASTIIPEPSTFLIWSLGLLGLAWYARRRRTS